MVCENEVYTFLFLYVNLVKAVYPVKISAIRFLSYIIISIDKAFSDKTWTTEKGSFVLELVAGAQKPEKK